MLFLINETLLDTDLSNSLITSGVAPFWGSYIFEAPFGPQRGLFTSESTNTLVLKKAVIYFIYSSNFFDFL